MSDEKDTGHDKGTASEPDIRPGRNFPLEAEPEGQVDPGSVNAGLPPEPKGEVDQRSDSGEMPERPGDTWPEPKPGQRVRK